MSLLIQIGGNAIRLFKIIGMVKEVLRRIKLVTSCTKTTNVYVHIDREDMGSVIKKT